MKKLRVLVACEFSGIVREALKKQGHDAWSCDILPTEIPGKHIQGDVLKILDDSWDMMIAHPPCTYLTVSGNKWMKPEFRNRFPTREQDRINAIKFFIKLMDAPIHKIAVENPIGIMSTVYRQPDQIINPFQFGHPETKATCLWLKNLNLLKATDIVKLPDNITERMRLHYLPPTEDRWKLRSKTFQGIADAMVEQWSKKQEIQEKLSVYKSQS